jgi:acyl-CoA thioester hydrolase
MAGDFDWPVRVYYEDTDAGGVVYYANYLKFMERARTEWLRALGFEQDRLRATEGVLLVVSRLSVEYRRPARFNELLQVGVRMSRLGKASLELDQEVAREGGEVLCAAAVRIACVEAATFRPRPLPPSLLRGIPVDD